MEENVRSNHLKVQSTACRWQHFLVSLFGYVEFFLQHRCCFQSLRPSFHVHLVAIPSSFVTILFCNRKLLDEFGILIGWACEKAGVLI